MPKLFVTETIHIQAAPDLVVARVRDFKQWSRWSPWLCAEPDCRLEFASDGKRYAWDGKIIGAGNMQLVDTALLPNGRQLFYQLEFLRPWKSVSKVDFTFIGKDGGTEVTWTMNGSLPLFLFFLKGMMTTLIGMDYERGLKMLKEYTETGTVVSQIDYPGEESVESFNYVGIRTYGKISEIEKLMEADFAKLFEWYEGQDVEAAGKPFTSYEAWKLGKGEVQYVIGLPMQSLKELPTELPEGLITGAIPACRAAIIQYTGPYRNLGNAWSAGMMRVQSKMIKQTKRVKPFEVYVNDPRETPENELITKLYFPVK